MLYLCLHHGASLLTDMTDKTIDVYHPLSIYLVQHGVKYNVCPGASYTSTAK